MLCLLVFLLAYLFVCFPADMRVHTCACVSLLNEFDLYQNAHVEIVSIDRSFCVPLVLHFRVVYCQDCQMADC